jgi:hypothetical protein
MAKVYFIEAPEVRRVKIGVASNVLERKVIIQTGSPCLVELLGFVDCQTSQQAYFVEAKLHELFRPYHYHSEWFNLTSSLREHIVKFVMEANLAVEYLSDDMRLLNKVTGRTPVPDTYRWNGVSVLGLKIKVSDLCFQ